MNESQDLYDAPPAQEPEAQTQAKDDMQPEEHLANVEAFPGAEPGKHYSVTISKVMGKECTFMAEPEDEGDGMEKPEGMPEESMAAAPSGGDSLMD